MAADPDGSDPPCVGPSRNWFTGTRPWPAADEGERGVATHRVAHGADASVVHEGAERCVGEHGVDRERRLPRTLERCTVRVGARAIVPVVAGMLGADHDEAILREVGGDRPVEQV